MAQIGVLVLSNADGQSLTRELRLGSRDFGFPEGQNFVFELRSAEGNTARLPQLAAEQTFQERPHNITDKRRDSVFS